MSRWLTLIILSAMIMPLWAQSSPNLGAVPGAEFLSQWSTSIDPWGNGLPEGSGNAIKGRPTYLAKCAACHGLQGEGLINDRLVGGHATLQDARAIKTVGSYWPYATTLYDYIRRAMPYNSPHTLTNDETYDLTAFILFMNGIISEDQQINQANLPDIIMPNKNNFFSNEFELP
jgi:mono/diheme cytochrome c family protein